MRNWLDDVAAVVATVQGGTIGTTIWPGLIPATASVEQLATQLYPYGGSEPQLDVGAHHVSLQLTHRCKSFDTAWAAAWALYEYFTDNPGPVRLGSAPNWTLLQEISALQPPFSIGLDETQSWRIVCNYELELMAD